MDYFEFLESISSDTFKYIEFLDNKYSKRNKKGLEATEHNGLISERVTRDKNIYIFLDTCTWINHADKGSFESFVKLVDLHIQRDAILLVPEQLEVEWDRNKEEKLTTSKLNAFNDMMNKTKSFRDVVVRDSNQKEQLDELIRQAETFKTEHIEYVSRQTILLVDQIIKQGIKVPTQDRIKIEATDIALKKLPPFHKNKNSMGDAILFLSLLSYLEKTSNSILYFVTDNKSDFSEDTRSPHKMHSSLIEMGQERGIDIIYSLDLNRTIGEIITEVTDEKYVNDYKLKYIDKYETNFKNRCPECNGRMMMDTLPWNGLGEKIIYKCEDCSYVEETSKYYHEHIHDSFY